MSRRRLGGATLARLVILWALALLPGLESSSRLSYHEALVGQGAREILTSGEWRYPTIGGLPWLEKPPLPWWLVAGLGWCTGRVTEGVARLPSALAAGALVVAVALLATRHYGRGIGMLAGAIQATTAWTVIRGRLAEADMLLACLVTWAIVAFDRLPRADLAPDASADSGTPQRRSHGARWAFFILLGASALVKGIGFGAALLALIGSILLVWERDRTLARVLWFPAGWGVAAGLAVAWPVMMVAQHGPEAIALWTTHFADRVVQHQGHGQFASEPWREYLPSVVGQALPWSPLALVGAWRSLGRALGKYQRGNQPRDLTHTAALGCDRLLWAWSAGPLILLSLATVKNAHYVVCAQVPWSIWAALELLHLGGALRKRGWDNARLIRVTSGAFAALAMAYGVGFWLLVPWFDRRGVEWAFYESAARQVPAHVPLALLYDDWDRDAYASGFEALPHDLAVRLFYLGRPACWHASAISLIAHVHTGGMAGSATNRWRAGGQHLAQPVASCSDRFERGLIARIVPAFVVIGRDRDLPDLTRLGCVEVLARGPRLRRDRTYTVFRITLLQPPTLNLPTPLARTKTDGRTVLD